MGADHTGDAAARGDALGLRFEWSDQAEIEGFQDGLQPCLDLKVLANLQQMTLDGPG